MALKTVRQFDRGTHLETVSQETVSFLFTKYPGVALERTPGLFLQELRVD